MAPSAYYPFAGVAYFVSHPHLWKKVILPFLLTLAFGVASLVIAFGFLLPLQKHALVSAGWPSLFAFFASIIFSILESAILDVIFFAIVLSFFQDALFDETLRERGLSRMFDKRVPVNGVVLWCRGVSSSILINVLLLLAKILILIITAPLQLLPIVGTALACYISGWPSCWSHHIHYDLEFRGFSVGDSRRWAWKHKFAYSNFGAVVVALELIPLFNLLFMWTNIVGTALWVADEYEKEEQAAIQQNASVPSNENSESARLITSNGNEELGNGYGSTIA